MCIVKEKANANVKKKKKKKPIPGSLIDAISINFLPMS